MAFVADDLAAWLTGLLADAGSKKLVALVLGTDQDRELRQAATKAVQRTAEDLCPANYEQAEQAALVISQVFSEPVPDAPLAEHRTVLEALQAGIAGQLAVLDDASLTGTGQSSADVLGASGTVLAEKLTGYLLDQIVDRGARGGPLFPLATQLNHDLSRLDSEQLKGMVGAALDALARLEGARPAAAPTTLAQLPPRRTAPYLATVREIRSWTRELRGRDAFLHDLISFAQGRDGYLLLEGPQYAGKTALLAELVTARLPPQVDVVSFFVSRIMSQADRYKFLAAVVPQLAEMLDVRVGEADGVAFRSLWQQAADRARCRDRHLLLVVDGLDEDLVPPDVSSIASLLPFAVAGRAAAWARAHVLVSNREGSPLPRDIPIGHPLRGLQPQTLAPYPGNKDYADLAQQEIEGLQALGEDARKVLGALAAAGGALAVPDLQHLTGLPGQRVRDLVKTVQRSLRPVGPLDSRRYAFADEFRRELLADPDLGVAGYRAAINSWAEEWRSRGWRADQDDHARVPRYLLEAYPDSLHGTPERRAGLVSDAGWVAAAIAQLSVDLVLAELHQCVAEAPGIHGPTAMLATVRGQAATLRLPGLETSQLLRQLCLQATELDEKELAGDIRRRLAAYAGPIPLWSTRRPYRALIAEVNAQAGWVNAVALARDGRVVAGTDDGRVWVWDPSTPSARALTIGRHDGPVRALAVDKDGRVVSGGHDKSVRLWHLDRIDAGRVNLGRHDGAVRAVAFLDADHVVSGGDDWLVRIWSRHGLVAGSTVLGRHAGAVRSVAVDRDGRIVSGGDDGRICLWDPRAPGTALAKMDATTGRIMAVAVAPDNSVIAAGTDCVLYRWYHELSDAHAKPDHVLQPGGQVAEFGSHHNVVRAVSVVRGGPREGLVVSGGDDGRLRLWRAHARGGERTELGRHDGPVRTVCAENDRAVSGGRDQRVRVWDLGEPNLAAAEQSKVPAGRAFALCVCPDGWVVSGGADGKLWLWEPSRAAGPIELGSHDSPVTSVTALAGSLVVSCAADGRLHLWDRAIPGELVRVPGTHDGAVLTSAGGSSVVSGGYDGRVLLWDVAGGGRPVRLGEHSGPVSAVTVLLDGRVATGGTAGDILISHARSPAGADIELEPIGSRLNALATLPGRLAGGGDDGRIWIWNLNRRAAELVPAHGSSWLTSLASLGEHLISAGTDGQMIAWKSGPGGLTRISTVACNVCALAWCQAIDGKNCLAVAHSDSGISYWQLNNLA